MVKASNIRIDRRRILVGVPVALAGALATGRSRAAGGQIIVANWGGDWSDRTAKYFEVPLVEKAGYTVVRDLGGLDQRRTKLIASRRLPRAPMDVAHLDDAVAFEMNALQVLETIDDAAVPRLSNVVPLLRTPYFVPWQYSAWLIGYNPEKISDAPKSFEDLWNPKFKGMIGLSDAHWYHHVEVAALKVGKTLDTIDIGAVKASMMEMKSATSPRIYPDHLQLEQALKNNEVAVVTEYKARLLQFASEGVKVASVYPKEGGIAIIFGATIPKKAPDPEGAKFYCNALLDPANLAELVQVSFYSPANEKTVLPEAAEKKIALSTDEQKVLHTRPHAFWLKNRAELLEWWNKEFKA